MSSIYRGDLQPGSIELNRRLPLWYQIAQHLRGTIVARRPADPERLPTEEVLAEHYGVSVATMRHALKTLEEEGLVERLRGRGTFVAPAVPSIQPLELRGTVDAVVAQQTADDVAVLARETVRVPPDLAERFTRAESLVFIRRMRSHQGEPSSVADNWVLPELAAQISDDDLRGGSMTQALRDSAGVQIGRFENVVEAQLASPDLVGLLEVALLSPVLLCTAFTYDEDGRLIDAARIRYRGDRFRYAITLHAHE